MLANTMNQKPGMVTGDVTVCVPGAMLAPAPAAEAPPVFVDDSGMRRKLIRVTGGLVTLLLVGFLGLVGVALAVPSVGATVGLGDVTPFLVPGAAAKPPAPAPVAVVKKRVQTIAPRSAPKPRVAPTAKPAPKKEAPVVIAPPTTAPPAPPTTAPPSSAPPVVDPPVQNPPVVDPPVQNPPVVDPPQQAAPAGAESPAPVQAEPVVLAQNG